MNKKAIWIVVAIVVVILVLVATNSHKSSSGVKIGAIAPLTGWGAYWADGYQRGVHMAADEVNTNGGKLDVVIEDGATDGAKSATAAQKLISVDKVDGLIVEFTAPASSVSPIAAQASLPMMYDAVTRKIAQSNPLAFKMYFDMDQQCYVAAKYLASHGSKHLGGLIMNLDFASECQAAMDRVAKETGVKVDYYLFPTDTVDFKTYIAKMQKDGIDGVVPVPFEDNVIAFFKQRATMRFTAPVFLGLGVPDAFSLKVRASVATSSLEGIMTFDQNLPQSFLQALTKKYSDITEKDYLSAAFGYDETMRLYRALSSCAKGDEVCVTEKLKTDAWPGALTNRGFDDNRVINVDPVYYRYTNGMMVQFDPTK